MKFNRSLFITLGIMLVMSVLYRIMPNRPPGFAPQMAIALFSGVLFVKNKKWAFALPLLSMFLSDLLYQALYLNGMSAMPEFYEGQWMNYLLFTALAIFGFFIRANKPASALGAVCAAPTAFFIVSNFMVWIGGGGWHHPKTFSGLMQCYVDGLPFYTNSLMATVVFMAVLMGGYRLVQNGIMQKERV